MSFSRSLPHYELKSRIKRLGDESAQLRQVSLRLQELLTAQKEAVRRKVNSSQRGELYFIKQYKALVHEDYCNALQELIDSQHLARKAKIEYETNRMLFDARRSVQKNQRA